MKTVAVKIPDALHKEFKVHAVNTGKTMAEIITVLIREYLHKEKEQTH